VLAGKLPHPASLSRVGVRACEGMDGDDIVKIAGNARSQGGGSCISMHLEYMRNDT
jgi:hypothetical protein